MQKDKKQKMNAEIEDVTDSIYDIAKKVKKRRELKVIPSPIKSIEFSEIKSNSKIHNQRKSKDILNWNGVDFASYVKDKYYIKYGKSLELNLTSSANEIQKLKDEILEIFGYINNVLVKMYLDFFIQRYMDQKITKTPFYFTQLKDKKYIKSFYIFCRDNIGYKIDKQIIVSKTKDINESNLENSFYLHKIVLVREYGIILTINWLIINKKYSRKDALEMILYTCLDSYKNGILKDIIDVTENLSPYPKQFVFKEIDKVNKYLTKKTGQEIAIKVLFSENNKFNFIRSK